MNKENKDRMLFDAVSGIDPELIQEAAEPRVRQFPRYLWRAAACFLVVIGLSLSILSVYRKVNFDKSQVSTDDFHKEKKIGLQINTNVGVVELSESKGTSFFSGEEASTLDEVPSLPDNYNRYVFNSITGEWEQVNQNTTLSCLTLELWWSDYFSGQPIDITVLKNGQEVDFGDKTEIFRSYIGQGTSDRFGWAMRCYLAEQATLSFVVRDEVDGSLLMDLTILVTPAIYYAEVMIDGVMQITEKEGYKVEVLKSFTKAIV